MELYRIGTSMTSQVVIGSPHARLTPAQCKMAASGLLAMECSADVYLLM
uniref:Uncharacterized protein n=1 Tax=Anguilla anguilla TaxID=7936 RepID=A0A0E9QX36_ANGAN